MRPSHFGNLGCRPVTQFSTSNTILNPFNLHSVILFHIILDMRITILPYLFQHDLHLNLSTQTFPHTTFTPISILSYPLTEQRCFAQFKSLHSHSHTIFYNLPSLAVICYTISVKTSFMMQAATWAPIIEERNDDVENSTSSIFTKRNGDRGNSPVLLLKQSCIVVRYCCAYLAPWKT